MIALLVACAMGQLVDAQTRQSYIDSLPRIADTELAEKLTDHRVLWYTEDEIPRAYQFQGGVHSAYYNISVFDPLGHGNANREFPWDHPGGILSSASRVTEGRYGVHGIWLPPGKPIVYFRERDAWHWLFPVDAVVFELLALHHNGRQYPWQIRVRVRERDAWGVDLLAPFGSLQELVARCQELRPGQTFDQLASSPITERTVSDTKHPRRAFPTVAMRLHELPELPTDLVAELLTSTPFESMLGAPWHPTTASPFHIVPAMNRSGIVGGDRESCMRCHEHTNLSVDVFHASRDWYGNVRGSDGIFSFHPFGRSCISPNGMNRAVSFSHALTRAGVIAPLNRARHGPETYSRILR